MQVRFFTVPVFGDTTAEGELNAFLASHRILHVDRHLVQDGAASAWAVCVATVAPESRLASIKKGRLDYREVLPADQFAVFARLRALRKELADRDGVPAYAIFTNEQLATMVTRGVKTRRELQEIDGVGPSRVEKYSVRFLEVLAQRVPDDASEKSTVPEPDAT